jgi:hypothetical protein
LLSRLFQHLPKHFLAAVQKIFFQVVKVLVGGAHRVVKYSRQAQ